MSTPITHLDLALEQAARGALFAVNHSGGKDSQAMLIRLLAAGIPHAQIVVVHAALGDVEWPGAFELAERQARDACVPFIVARAGKDLLGMVANRFATRPEVPSWPSSATRQCTSDLKRGPIRREIGRLAEARHAPAIVNCMGLRAAESRDRAKKAPWVRSERQSRKERRTLAGRVYQRARDWFDWLPVHHLSTAEVFETIGAAGQEPHPAYAAGNERLSCVFCIMGSANDARIGAIRHPELYARYVALEERTGYTMHQDRRPLVELTGLTVEQARAEHRQLPVLREAV
jgi:3'-phosphoadenosine 5'-phosphosulfate sulfotransferase (PAPS reductase)/FAD synthetase